MRHAAVGSAAACLFLSAIAAHGQTNLLQGANGFDAMTKQIDNPWGGVDNGVLTVMPGKQKAVNDAGSIVASNPGPSVGVGDLNGDNLPDLVVADAKGFFWFFPNVGKPGAPAFNHGEVMPIWIANPHVKDQENTEYSFNESEDNAVPRIHLVDFDHDGKLDIVAGNYEGKLYYILNRGSAQRPMFSMPQNLDTIMVPTYSKGLLWCNFLAPYLYDWRGNGVMDLLMGEGTYASNSIYLLTNKGSNASPSFSDQFTTKIIPGLGREHLTPQVVDWNNDGKPDVLTGERAGFISIFLNTTTDPSKPTFDQGNHVLFGGKDNYGPFATAAVTDLTGNKMPNLILSSADNKITYAENKGTPGSPKFELPLPLKGTNPIVPPKVIAPPPYWALWKSLGIPYTQLSVTNAQVEPDFKGPNDTIKSALRFFQVPHTNVYFPNGFYPQEDTQIIRFMVGNDGNPVVMKPHTQYKLSFWIRNTGDDPQNFVYIFKGLAVGGKNGHQDIWIKKPIDVSKGWTQFSDTFDFQLNSDITAPPEGIRFAFMLAFNGHPNLYFADFQLVESH